MQLGYEGFVSYDLPPSLARFELYRDDKKWTVELMLEVLQHAKGSKIVEDYLEAGNSIDNKTFERVLNAVVEGRNNKKLFVKGDSYLRDGIADDPVIIVTQLLHTMESAFFSHVQDGFDVIELGPGKGEVACLLLHVGASKLKTLTLFETRFEAQNLVVRLRASFPRLMISLNGQRTASELDTRNDVSALGPHVHIIDTSYVETWVTTRLATGQRTHIFLDGANLLNSNPSSELAYWYFRNVLPWCEMIVLTHFGPLGTDKVGERTFDLAQLLSANGFCRSVHSAAYSFRVGAGRSAFTRCPAQPAPIHVAR
jgi:hypothetical protein